MVVGSIRRRMVRLILARLLLCIGVLGASLAFVGSGREGAEVAERGLYGTLAFVFLLTGVYTAMLRFVRRPGRFGGLQLATDVGLVSSLVYFSGGADSIFSFLYVLITLYGAILFDRRGAYAAAALGSLCYGGVLVAAERSGIGALFGGTPAEAPLYALWGIHTAALLLVAMLSSALARELRIAGEALHESTIDLRELRWLHERTVDSLMSGLLTTDGEGRITSFNPEAERITGHQAGEVMGHRLEEILPGAGELLREEVIAVRGTGGRSRMGFRDRSGLERHLGLAGSILRDVDGSSKGHVVIFQDVTDVVAMEQDLRRSERLAAAGQLAADMAHEIRNPLAAISGSVEMLHSGLGESVENGERRRLMGIVLREIDRLDRLISDFLLYARPAPPKRVPVDLGQLVGDVLGMFDAARPEGLEVEVEIGQHTQVLADPTQMRQLFWNLVLNASQAMPEGGHLRVSARVAGLEPQASGAGDRNEAEEGSAWVEITVADTGTGISPEVLERVFDPFFTTKRGGSGLGLATVHRVVEGNGGTLRVESRVGEGSAFRIRLPAVEEGH